MGNRNPKDNSDYGLKDFFEQVWSSVYNESTRADLKVLSTLLLCGFVAVVVNYADIVFASFLQGVFFFLCQVKEIETLLDKMSNIVHKLQVNITLFLKFGSEMLVLRDNMCFPAFPIRVSFGPITHVDTIYTLYKSTGS